MSALTSFASLVPIDAETAALVLIAMNIANGAVMSAGPRFYCKSYGIPKDQLGSFTDILGGRYGWYQMSMGIVLYAMVVENASLVDATKIGTLIWIYHKLGSQLRGEADEISLGRNNMMSIGLLALEFYCLCQPYAETALKVFSTIWALFGLQAVVAPHMAWKLWQADPNLVKTDADVLKLWQADPNLVKTDADVLTIILVGCAMLSYGLGPLSMFYLDASAVQAAGYGSLVWVFVKIMNLSNGIYARLGMPLWMHYFAALFEGVLSAVALANI